MTAIFHLLPRNLVFSLRWRIILASQGGVVSATEGVTVILSIAQMQALQGGRIVACEGGHGFIRRLDAMGIRPGVPIEKIVAQPFRGPSVVRVCGTQVAIGFGMAQRILVEVGE